MDRRTLDRHRDTSPASPGLSRLLVLAYLIAALLGLAAGVAWMGWTAASRWLGF
jgi:hypothetical protein